ncbi:hypothetical protein Glove_295g36 [Diversispora epigaea]|uniref:Peptidase S8/S53 domain-containing protein n=1 Tax=Diversispora epigaea TaxID=1348612 RepID=A0A397I599_9GLOM|nr:hypothetical protein Glove_295g36 [Diversispora epigaea]
MDKLIIKLSLAIIIILALINQIKSKTIKCPKLTKRGQNQPSRVYIVLLKNSGLKSSSLDNNNDENIKTMHFQVLESCFKLDIIKTTDLIASSLINSPKTVLDISVPGCMTGYIGNFPANVAGSLKTLPEVSIIEPDSKLKIADVQNNPPSNLDRIDQPSFPLNKKYTYPSKAGNNVNTFVVDSGINVKHVDFGGRAKWFATYCTGCPNIDDNGHGTSVASIIGGKTYGVAKKTALYAVKILNKAGSGDLSSAMRAFSDILKFHKNNKNKNTIVNLSLSGGKSQALDSAVGTLADNGIHVIVAAGNDYKGDACAKSPSGSNRVITVGALNTNNNYLADFSNVGSCVTLFAPGVNIPCAGPSSSKNIISKTGTSQAAPHVAGAVALIISVNGNKSPDQMKALIINLSTKNVIVGLDSRTPNRILRINS